MGDSFMHLLYVDPHPVPDVVPEAMQILQTVDALARKGCRITLATPAPTHDCIVSHVLGRPLHPDVELITLRDLRKSWLPIRSGKFFYREACRLVASQKADGILVRNLKLAEALIRLPMRPPLVFETHELFARTYQEDHPTPGWRERRKLAALRSRESGVYNGSDGIAALTPWLLEDLRLEYGVETPGAVVPDGVDLAFAAECAIKKAPSSPPVLLYIGSLHPWKGLERLIAALPYIDDSHLHIVGGPDKRIGELKAIAEQLGVADRVRFLGSVMPDKRFDVIAGADICLLPLSDTSIGSRYTSPLKLFEYMAVGRPIVAADVPALRQIVRHEQEALLAPVDNPQTLADQVNRILKNPSLGARLASAAKNRAQDFSWEARAGVIIDLFRSIA